MLLRMPLTLHGHVVDTDLASDTELVNAVAAAISVPRRDPADSFVLHAPLELTARAALLPYVATNRRAEARSHIVRMAKEFDDFGPGIDEPVVVHPPFATAADATSALGDAMQHADLERADEIAAWMGTNLDPSTLRSCLADVVAPSLAAAAHGSIFLYLLPRVAVRGEGLTSMLRPLVRELARYPELHLSWQRALVADQGSRRDPSTLRDALASVPRLGVPGSDFIFPVMHQVESAGVAADVLYDALAGVGLTDARSAITRIAAQSMLHEPDTYAPYGWSHCLTMAQAVLGTAPYSAQPEHLIAIAATYVVGFRAAFGTVDLDTTEATAALVPLPGNEDNGAGVLGDALRNGADRPTVAAAAAHAYVAAPDHVRALLATYASTQEDAHLVKYVLASFDAAASDPACAALYMAAAASLCAYWGSKHRSGV